MGQSFKKPTARSEEAKDQKEKIMQECYEKYFNFKDDKCSQSDFYLAICRAVEKLNEGQGYTQVRAIDKDTLFKEYEAHHDKRGSAKPTKEEFRKIMGALEKKLEFTGVGVKDTLLSIFGVPASATFIKNAIMPGLVSNEVLIPGMTSLTVLVLAKLNKI